MKFEEDLAIDNSAKKQAELDKVYKEKSQLEAEKMKYGNLEKDFESLKGNMESIISEKITQQSTKLLKDLEKIMENSSKRVQMKMESGDIDLLKKISKDDLELAKMKDCYFYPEK